MSDSWMTFAVGAPVRCPHCRTYLCTVGPALEIRARIHPGGSGADPTEPRGFSHKCRRCLTQLELMILPRVTVVRP